MDHSLDNIITLRLRGLNPDNATIEFMSEYMKILYGLIGDIKGIRFDKIKKGSAILQMEASCDVQSEAYNRMKNVTNGLGTAEQQKYFEALQKQNDERRVTKVSFNVRDKVLDIPLLKQKHSPIYELNQLTEMEGRIIKLGGADDTIPMTFADYHNLRVNCNVKISLAKELKQYLFEDTYLILSGDGCWKRENSKWKLQKCDVATVFWTKC